MRLPCQRSALKRSFLLYYLIITFSIYRLHKEVAKLAFLLSSTKHTAKNFLQNHRLHIFTMTLEKDLYKLLLNLLEVSGKSPRAFQKSLRSMPNQLCSSMRLLRISSLNWKSLRVRTKFEPRYFSRTTGLFANSSGVP